MNGKSAAVCTKNQPPTPNGPKIGRQMGQKLAAKWAEYWLPNGLKIGRRCMSHSESKKKIYPHFVILKVA